MIFVWEFNGRSITHEDNLLLYLTKQKYFSKKHWTNLSVSLRQRAANQYWIRGDLEEAFGLFTKTQTPPAEIYCLYDTLFSDTTAGVSVAGLPEDKTQDYHVFLLQYVSKTGKIHPNFFFFISCCTWNVME